jgi:DNA-binding transcriptional regulator YhcF (GntR family)
MKVKITSEKEFREYVKRKGYIIRGAYGEKADISRALKVLIRSLTEDQLRVIKGLKVEGNKEVEVSSEVIEEMKKKGINEEDIPKIVRVAIDSDLLLERPPELLELLKKKMTREEVIDFYKKYGYTEKSVNKMVDKAIERGDVEEVIEFIKDKDIGGKAGEILRVIKDHGKIGRKELREMIGEEGLSGLLNYLKKEGTIKIYLKINGCQ